MNRIKLLKRAKWARRDLEDTRHGTGSGTIACRLWNALLSLVTSIEEEAEEGRKGEGADPVILIARASAVIDLADTSGVVAADTVRKDLEDYLDQFRTGGAES